jgi:hypothetical protein
MIQPRLSRISRHERRTDFLERAALELQRITAILA